MRPIRVVALSVVLLGSFLAHVTWAQDAATALVVEVVNGTAEGATVIGDSVTLQVFRQQQLQNTLEAQVRETGEAVFEDVPMGLHMVAKARVRHQNMTFQGSAVSLAPGKDDYSTSVRVFDVSTDTSALSVGTHHLMLSVQESMLAVTEYMQLKNTSDMAVRGSKRDAQDRPVVIEVMLPDGAMDLTPTGFFSPGALVTTETGFYDTLAVPPGEHQVRFSYRIDMGQGALDITKAVSLPTSELTVFWEAQQGELTGLGEPDEQLTNAQSVPIECYRRHDLQAGDRIAFQISGFHVQTSDRDTWIVLAVAFAVIVALALWRLRSGSPPNAD